MSVFRNVRERLKKTPEPDDLSREPDKIEPNTNFFQRQIKLRGNSQISVPLAVVLLFPCLVIILIAFLFLRHSAIPGRPPANAGAASDVRYVVDIVDLGHDAYLRTKAHK